MSRYSCLDPFKREVIIRNPLGFLLWNFECSKMPIVQALIIILDWFVLYYLLQAHPCRPASDGQNATRVKEKDPRGIYLMVSFLPQWLWEYAVFRNNILYIYVYTYIYIYTLYIYIHRWIAKSLTFTAANGWTWHDFPRQFRFEACRCAQYFG